MKKAYSKFKSATEDITQNYSNNVALNKSEDGWSSQNNCLVVVLLKRCVISPEVRVSLPTQLRLPPSVPPLHVFLLASQFSVEPRA